MQVCLTSTFETNSNHSAPLLYQIGLLRQRNKLLALENKSLLLRIEQMSDSLSKAQQKLQKSQKENVLLKQESSKQKIHLIRFIDQIQESFPSNNLLIVQEMIKNSCSVSNIIQAMRQSISHVPKPKQKSSQNLAKLTKQLQNRKQRFVNKTRQPSQIIHIIKQPLVLSNSNTEADLEYVIRSAEKTIRRVKRSDIRSQYIGEIMEQIREFIRLRKQVRQSENAFKNAQREVQLKVGCRLVVQELGQHLLQLGKMQLQMKSNIQTKINQLPMK